MPDHYPFIERDHADSGLAAYLDPRPHIDFALDAGWEALALVNPAGTNGQNAAGTAENLALHVAMIVAFALVGVYLLRASDFKFVVAGSIG